MKYGNILDWPSALSSQRLTSDLEFFILPNNYKIDQININNEQVSAAGNIRSRFGVFFLVIDVNVEPPGMHNRHK